MDVQPELVGLFFTSLIAGTLLPFLPASSEIAMAGLLALGVAPPAVLVSVATGANVLGTTVNYGLGRSVGGLTGKRWFPLSESTLEKARLWFARYGIWVLALCWLPTLGDALTVVAGLLRAHFLLFLALVAAGKLFGHAVVAGGVSFAF